MVFILVAAACGSLMPIPAGKAPVDTAQGDSALPDTGPRPDSGDSGDTGFDQVECSGESLDRLNIYVTFSDSPTVFETYDLIYTQGSVPSIYWDPNFDDGSLSFMMMTFAEEPGFCDTMVVTALDPDTRTLGPLTKVQIEGLPEAEVQEDGTPYPPGDPTMVSVGSMPTLVYTIRSKGSPTVCVAVGTSTTGSFQQGKFEHHDQLVICDPANISDYMDASAMYHPTNPDRPDDGGVLWIYFADVTSFDYEEAINYYYQINIPDPLVPENWTIAESGLSTSRDVYLLGAAYGWTDGTCPYSFYGSFRDASYRTCSNNGRDWFRGPKVISGALDPGFTGFWDQWVAIGAFDPFHQPE